MDIIKSSRLQPRCRSNFRPSVQQPHGFYCHCFINSQYYSFLVWFLDWVSGFLWNSFPSSPWVSTCVFQIWILPGLSAPHPGWRLQNLENSPPWCTGTRRWYQIPLINGWSMSLFFSLDLMEQNSRGLLLSSFCRVILVGQEPGTEFKEGPNIIRYKVYDQARNRAGCKFIVRIEGKFNDLYLIYHLG